jgi:hypothetical protein
MRITERAVIQKAIECQQQLVVVLALVRSQMAELNQPVDLCLAQVGGSHNASRLGGGAVLRACGARRQ